jgi:hypothetical protein
MKPAAPVTIVVRHLISGSEPPQFDDGGLCGMIEPCLDVEHEARAIAQQALNKRLATVDIGLMGDGENDRICRLQRVQLGQCHPKLMSDIGSVRQRIMDLHHEPEKLKLANDVDDAGVACVIGTVSFCAFSS